MIQGSMRAGDVCVRASLASWATEAYYSVYVFLSCVAAGALSCYLGEDSCADGALLLL